MATRLIYLLLFLVPQVLIYLYLRERLPDPNQPDRARVVRRALAVIFITLNIPWLLVGARVLFGGSVWSVGRIPFTGPWIAWQLLGWIYGALVAMYVLGKAIWWLARRLAGSGERLAPLRVGMPMHLRGNRSPLPPPRCHAAAFSPAPRTSTLAPVPPCRRTGSGAPIGSPRSPDAHSPSRTSRPVSMVFGCSISPTCTPACTSEKTRCRRSWRGRTPSSRN